MKISPIEESILLKSDLNCLYNVFSMLLDYLTVCYFKLSLKLKTDMKTCILSKTNKSFKLNFKNNNR